MSKVNELTLADLREFAIIEEVQRYFRIRNNQCLMLTNSSIEPNLVRLNFKVLQNGKSTRTISLLCSDDECRVLESGKDNGLLSDIWKNFLNNLRSTNLVSTNI